MPSLSLQRSQLRAIHHKASSFLQFQKHPAALNAIQVAEVKSRAAAGESKTALALVFDVSRETIYKAIRA